jgi:periplasmic glucans biosynthesis protein
LIRLLIASLSLAAPSAPMASAGDPRPFNEAWLRAHAQQLARSEYVATTQKCPPALAALSFDEYRTIRFRPEASIWRSARSPFELQLFHLGHFFTEPVSLYLVEGGRAHPLRFAPELFDYGGIRFDEPLPETLGLAGFRVHSPLNRKDYLDEVLAFLGASYFRALGRGSAYGLSARGLAIDTALPGGEVFPVFREFYVEKPAAGARHLVVHALLDSPSISGAYRFDLFPGDPTEVRVDATLFPRRSVERLGVAPLSSMYLFGENDRRGFDDYRPEVHDSDGLLIWFGNGERLWRPLQNPERLEVSALRAESLKGFGLLQRDRQTDHYQDLEALYERRPGVWIEPIEGFGSGTVYLVEIPSREEIHDNVVAFFTPEAKPVPGTPIHFAYRMTWGMAPSPPVAAATVVATRLGDARQVGLPAEKQGLDAQARKFVVDFVSPAPLAVDGTVEALVTASGGSVKSTRVQPYPAIGGYRAVFDFEPGGQDPVEMRCFLRRNQVALSETWSYRFSPPHRESK